MKTTGFSLLTAILIACSLNVHAVSRITKKIYRNYSLSQVKMIDVTNKYGNIYIDNNRKDSVIINVEVWVEGTGNKAKELMDRINVSVNLNGNTVTAVTSLGSFFSNDNQQFSIDYRISVPEDRDLAIDQKYGNVVMKNLTGKGKFRIGYGALTAGKLFSPELDMNISYSKANIEQTGNLNLDLGYSKMSLNKGANIKSQTKYSNLDAGELAGLITESKYDHYKIKDIKNLQMNAMYTGTEIDKLNTKLYLENGYGGFSVDQIPAGFESIVVKNRYAAIKLGIASDASYKLEGKVRYCDLKHPEGKLNKTKETVGYTVNGIIGKSDNPKSDVKVESQYGSINLMH